MNREKQTKQQVPKKSMEKRKAVWVLLFECQEEKERPLRGHQYGNGILMQRSAAREDSQTFGHPYGLPVCRAKIFSV
jgi:hypothetical protein